MSNWIVSPPVAILLYLGLVGLLYGFGRVLSPKVQRSAAKETLYANGEVAEVTKAAPGYRRFFVVALFFAVLHLGALVLGTVALGTSGAGAPPGMFAAVIIYLVGLSFTLLVLMLG